MLSYLFITFPTLRMHLCIESVNSRRTTGARIFFDNYIKHVNRVLDGECCAHICDFTRIIYSVPAHSTIRKMLFRSLLLPLLRAHNERPPVRRLRSLGGGGVAAAIFLQLNSSAIVRVRACVLSAAQQQQNNYTHTHTQTLPNIAFIAFLPNCRTNTCFLRRKEHGLNMRLYTVH